MNIESDYPLRYISLFSGIGGHEVAIHKLFCNAVCLGYSEIDKYAIKIYEKHFPSHERLGDIRNIDAKPFEGKVDLLIGSSPCQNFSKLGNRKGLDGDQSSLFFHFVRILNECKPKYFLLENVKMCSTDRDKISNLLKVQPVEINSRIISYQSRKRLYWCNWNINKLKELPFLPGTINNILLNPNDKRLNEIKWKDMKNEVTGSLDKRIKSLLENKPLPNSQYIKLIKRTDEATRTACKNDSQYEWIDEGKNIIRNIHPVERERFQTFPDNYTEGISRTRRNQTLGNAVTCDVIGLILELLISNFNL